MGLAAERASVLRGLSGRKSLYCAGLAAVRALVGKEPTGGEWHEETPSHCSRAVWELCRAKNPQAGSGMETVAARALGGDCASVGRGVERASTGTCLCFLILRRPLQFFFKEEIVITSKRKLSLLRAPYR